MKRNSRWALLVAFIFILLLGSACRLLSGTPITSGGTALPDGQVTATASATSSSLSNVQLIPITGKDDVAMQCQFCVGQETHAMLVLPESAYFDVDQSTSVSCLTADVVSGRRIVICHGPQSVSFNLKICSDISNCLQFPIYLQPCDQLQGRPAAPAVPVILTPLSTHRNNNSNQPANPPPPTATQGGAQPQATNPPPVGPTKPPEPTKEPKPTKEPQPTKEPKPTKMPKPTKNKP